MLRPDHLHYEALYPRPRPRGTIDDGVVCLSQMSWSYLRAQVVRPLAHTILVSDVVSLGCQDNFLKRVLGDGDLAVRVNVLVIILLRAPSCQHPRHCDPERDHITGPLS